MKQPLELVAQATSAFRHGRPSTGFKALEALAETFAKLETLLAQYDEWDSRRGAIWGEEAGDWDNYRPDDMGYSDDEGVELLREFEAVLRPTFGTCPNCGYAYRWDGQEPCGGGPHVE